MYVVSGSFDYCWRSAGSDAEPNRIRVGPGELVFTPAMVEHAVVFLEDTSFVNFSDQHRDQEAYEADIVRVQLVPAAEQPAG
jgi:hypothetical protein